MRDAANLYENVPFRECSPYVSRETPGRRGERKCAAKSLFINPFRQKSAAADRSAAEKTQRQIALRGG
jgi:hypothetical protein